MLAKTIASYGIALGFAIVGTNLAVAQVDAQVSRLQPSPISNLPRGSEFNVGQYPGEVLLPVYVLGAVLRPGVYHVPRETDLLRLISLAGGTASNALREEMTIKRISNNVETVTKIDFDKLLTASGGTNPVVLAGDTIFIPTKEPIISPEVSSIMAFIATTLSLVTTTIILEDRMSKGN